MRGVVIIGWRCDAKGAIGGAKRTLVTLEVQHGQGRSTEGDSSGPAKHRANKLVRGPGSGAQVESNLKHKNAEKR